LQGTVVGVVVLRAELVPKWIAVAMIVAATYPALPAAHPALLRLALLRLALLRLACVRLGTTHLVVRGGQSQLASSHLRERWVGEGAAPDTAVVRTACQVTRGMHRAAGANRVLTAAVSRVGNPRGIARLMRSPVVPRLIGVSARERDTASLTSISTICAFSAWRHRNPNGNVIVSEPKDWRPIGVYRKLHARPQHIGRFRVA